MGVKIYDETEQKIKEWEGNKDYLFRYRRIVSGNVELIDEENIWGPSFWLSIDGNFVLRGQRQVQLGDAVMMYWEANPAIPKEDMIDIVLEEAVNLFSHLYKIFKYPIGISGIDLAWLGEGPDREGRVAYQNQQATLDEIKRHPEYSGLWKLIINMPATGVGLNGYGKLWTPETGHVGFESEYANPEWFIRLFERTSKYGRLLQDGEVPKLLGHVNLKVPEA